MRLELAGWLGSLLAGAVAWALLGRVDALALAAVAGEWVGFYGAAWLLERGTLRRRQDRAAPRAAAHALLAEFALAETLDALVVRPLAIALATTLVPPPFLAVVLGGTVADVAFYAVAAVGRRSARGKTGATASDSRCALDLAR